MSGMKREGGCTVSLFHVQHCLSNSVFQAADSHGGR